MTNIPDQELIIDLVNLVFLILIIKRELKLSPVKQKKQEEIKQEESKNEEQNKENPEVNQEAGNESNKDDIPLLKQSLQYAE